VVYTTTSKVQVKIRRSVQDAALDRNCLHPAMWPKVLKWCTIFRFCGIRES
jgi:hypothetical protein